MKAATLNARGGGLAALVTIGLVEIGLGVCALVLPSKMALLLLVLPPVLWLFATRPLYAYFLAILLLPIWSLTLTGQAETPGQIDIRLSDMLFVLAGLGWLAHALQNNRMDFRSSPLDLPLFIFFLWILASLLWTPNVFVGMKELLRKLEGLYIFYLTVNLIKDRRDLKMAVIVWILAGLVAASLGFHEAVTAVWQRIGRLSGMATRWGGYRAGGLEVTPNIMGFFLNTALMLTISQMLAVRKWQYRALALVAILVMVFALISTLSRGSIVGFVLGLTLLVVLSKRGLKELGMMSAVAVMLFVSVLLVGGPAYRNVVLERYSAIFQPELAGGFVRRMFLWSEVATGIFTQHAIMGAGVGGFVTLSGAFGAWRLKSAHNLYIYLASELGVVGFLLFLVVVAGIVLLARRAFASGMAAGERCIFSGLLAALFLYGFQGLAINFVLREAELWILLGLTVTAARIFSKADKEAVPARAVSRRWADHSDGIMGLGYGQE